MNEAGQVKVRPRSIGELLDLVFRQYGRGFAFLLKSALMILLPYLVIEATVNINMQTTFKDFLNQAISQGAMPNMSGVFAHVSGLMAGLSILILSEIIVFPLLYGTILRFVIRRTLLDEPTQIRQAVGHALKRLGPVVLTSLVLGLVGLGAFIVLGVLIAILAIAARQASAAVMAFVLTIVIVAATVGLLWIGVRLMFVTSVVLEEDVMLWKSVARSWTLTRRKFWRVFGFMVLLELIVGTIAGGLGGAAGLFHQPVVTSVVTGLVSLFSLPFVEVAKANLYVDMRIRTDAHDLDSWVLPQSSEQAPL